MDGFTVDGLAEEVEVICVVDVIVEVIVAGNRVEVEEKVVVGCVVVVRFRTIFGCAYFSCLNVSFSSFYVSFWKTISTILISKERKVLMRYMDTMQRKTDDAKYLMFRFFAFFGGILTYLAIYLEKDIETR